jgi:hypothetical protein
MNPEVTPLAEARTSADEPVERDVWAKTTKIACPRIDIPSASDIVVIPWSPMRAKLWFEIWQSPANAGAADKLTTVTRATRIFIAMPHFKVVVSRL